MKIKNVLLYICLAGLIISSCKPRIKKGDELPAPSDASFSVKQYIDPLSPSDMNTFIFTNTTENGFISVWDFGGIAKSTQQVDTVFFAAAGDYTVTLKTSSPGGTTTTSKVIHIASDSPYKADFTITTVDANHFTLTALTPNILNGYFALPTGDTTHTFTKTIYLPFAGTFDVTLYATTAKGYSFVTKQITVASDDASNPAISDPIFTLLTGGVNDLDGKTWLLALPTDITGVGPYISNKIDVSYYAYPASQGGYGSAWVNGAATNEYTFIFNKYQYVPLNHNVTVHYNYAVTYFNKPYVQYNDLALQDPNHKAVPFILKNEGVGITGYTLTFGEKSYLSYMDGRQHYEIAKISADSMWVRHKYNDDPTADPKNDQNARVLLYTAKP